MLDEIHLHVHSGGTLLVYTRDIIFLMLRYSGLPEKIVLPQPQYSNMNK